MILFLLFQLFRQRSKAQFSCWWRVMTKPRNINHRKHTTDSNINPTNNSIHWMSCIHLKPLSVYSYFSSKCSLTVFRNRNHLQNSSLSDQAVINGLTINEQSKHISPRKSGSELHLFKSWDKTLVFQNRLKKKLSEVAQGQFCKKIGSNSYS